MNSVENGITTEQVTAACGDGQVNIFKASGTTKQIEFSSDER